MDESPTAVDEARQHLRTVLRDVNDLIGSIEGHGLPDGTHALASALRQRIDDLAAAIDHVIAPQGGGVPRRSPEPSTAVDESTLRTLIDDLGDAGRVSYLVQLFLTELHGRRQAMTTAVEQGDLTMARSVAHTLKSSAFLLGANTLGKACEVLSNSDDASALRPMVDEVLTQATAAARWFQIWLANQPVNG